MVARRTRVGPIVYAILLPASFCRGPHPCGNRSLDLCHRLCVRYLFVSRRWTVDCVLGAQLANTFDSSCQCNMPVIRPDATGSFQRRRISMWREIASHVVLNKAQLQLLHPRSHFRRTRLISRRTAPSPKTDGDGLDETHDQDDAVERKVHV